MKRSRTPRRLVIRMLAPLVCCACSGCAGTQPMPAERAARPDPAVLKTAKIAAKEAGVPAPQQPDEVRRYPALRLQLKGSSCQEEVIALFVCEDAAGKKPNGGIMFLSPEPEGYPWHAAEPCGAYRAGVKQALALRGPLSEPWPQGRLSQALFYSWGSCDAIQRFNAQHLGLGQRCTQVQATYSPEEVYIFTFPLPVGGGRGCEGTHLIVKVNGHGTLLSAKSSMICRD